MFAQAGGVTFREDLGVEETTETDNIVRWDGEKLYVEHDI